MSQYRKCVGIIWALVLVLSAPNESLSQGSSQDGDPPVTQDVIGPVMPAKEADKRGRTSEGAQTLNWETGAGRSYIIPAAEILAYLLLLNLFDRHYTEPTDLYRTDGSTFWQNLTDSKWVIDNDQFSVNQFLHPYSGSIYYGLARSAGLSFWESFLYSAAGSFLWEMGGEKTPPSTNDMIATSIGGTFLGEPLFRMANLVLETDEGKPGFLRELAAAVISPPTGFNRLVFGNRFDTVLPSYQPATFLRIQAGGTLTSSSQNVASSVTEHGAVGDVTFTYGLPGKPEYRYARPFDYFDFHATAVTANAVESVNSRGLLVGSTYASGETSRGVWGLFGSYDYISPQVFRISTTALNVGTVWQSWLSPSIALQGTALAGAGYGAGGSIQRSQDRDYHYGVTPQALVALRLILGDRVLIDFTGREYYVSDVLGSEKGQENIARADASLTLRIFDQHGVALRYVVSHRDASYPIIDYRDQTVGTLSLMYVLLGSSGFGAVEWR